MPPYNTRTSKLLSDCFQFVGRAAVQVSGTAFGSVIQMSYSVSSYNRKQKVRIRSVR